MIKKPILICICGCKNSGKTTLITKLIKKLCELGYKVATVKHDGHDFNADIEDTDTYKHRQSGAYGTAIFSKNKFMIVKEQKETQEQELISYFPEADLIFLEGLKNSNYPKFEIIRKDNSKISVCNKENLISILSDMDKIQDVEKIINLNDIDLIVKEILKYMKEVGQNVENKLNHFDSNGNAIMVDVTDKNVTERQAIARGKIYVNKEIFERIKDGSIEKGDVLGVARVAGIMGTKNTSNLIPMCHPLMLTKATIDFELNEEEKSISAICTVKLQGKTGVEMEALTGVNVSLLTIYDMCKAIDKSMIISDIHLVEKLGGKSGHFEFSSEK